jgi:hypothetical protein
MKVKKVIQCYFKSCRETIEIDEPEVPQARGGATVLAGGGAAPTDAGVATFGHATYARVAFLPHDEHRLSGRPWTCAFHDAMVGATLGLSEHEEKQRQSLVTQLRIGRMTKAGGGWYSQVKPKPVPDRIIREDDGSIRQNGTMMRWFTQEQMLRLNGEPAPSGDYKVGPTAEGRTSVFVKDPPPNVEPDADEAIEL